MMLPVIIMPMYRSHAASFSKRLKSNVICDLSFFPVFAVLATYLVLMHVVTAHHGA